MYASFTSVMAKNGKTLTPTGTGIFLLTLMDWVFYAMFTSLLPSSHWVFRLSKNFKLKRTTSQAETETYTASQSS